jgi:hypothetical protein
VGGKPIHNSTHESLEEKQYPIKRRQSGQFGVAIPGCMNNASAMWPGKYIAVLGVVGLSLGVFALASTLIRGTAILRGGRGISRTRNPRLYGANIVGILALIIISAWLVYLGILGRP